MSIGRSDVQDFKGAELAKEVLLHALNTAGKARMCDLAIEIISQAAGILALEGGKERALKVLHMVEDAIASDLHLSGD